MSQVKPSLVALAAGLLALTQVAYATDSVADRSFRLPIHVPVPRGNPQCYSSAPSHSFSTPTPSPTVSTPTPTYSRPTATPTKTGIPSGPDPNEDCYRPSPFDEPIDIDQLCKCDYYDPEMSDPGGVQCWVTCDPYKPDQFKVVPDNDKLSSCINACLGSFEKAKRAVEAGIDISKRQDEYWFCHAVNFVEGELCEFIGDIGGYTYTPWAASCWQVPGLPTG
ncbi:hypothetical protein EKO27_g5027 [Xylaria grammica]|uniref:Apple domain-containing protein n=1 Tax=Xylaria grammica TaxID=363999 RepID=A0A439D6Q7_9PEZI|nr:hypothetical protein EKO27_g5027 [Xylaria grammica]